MEEERLNKIKKMISYLVTDDNERINNTEKIVNKIKQKYKILKYYDYITTDYKIKKGDIIKYIDLELKKLSVCGLVIDISYIDDYNKKKILSYHLYNPYKKIFWYISPKKYYLFRSQKRGHINNINITDYLKENILKEHIEQYKNDNKIN